MTKPTSEAWQRYEQARDNMLGDYGLLCRAVLRNDAEGRTQHDRGFAAARAAQDDAVRALEAELLDALERARIGFQTLASPTHIVLDPHAAGVSEAQARREYAEICREEMVTVLRSRGRLEGE
jgi:hypothetical protein